MIRSRSAEACSVRAGRGSRFGSGTGQRTVGQRTVGQRWVGQRWAGRRRMGLAAGSALAVAVGVLGSAGPARAVQDPADWAQPNRDGANTAYSAAPSPLDSTRVAAGLDEAWTVSAPDTHFRTDASGITSGSLVYFSEEYDGTVVARSRTDGAEVWRVLVAAPSSGSFPTWLVAGGGLVVVQVVGDSRRLVALDAATGASVWSTDLLVREDAPVIDDGRLFVSTLWDNGENPDGVAALDLDTGDVLWRRDGDTVVAATGGRVYSRCDDDRAVCAADAVTGATLWSSATMDGLPTDRVSAAVTAGRVYLYIHWQPQPGLGVSPSVLRALDPATGAVLWNRYAPGGEETAVPGNLAVVGGDVVVVASDESVPNIRLYRLDGANGVTRWVGEAPGVVGNGRIAAAGDVLYTTCRFPTWSDGFLCTFSLADGRPLSTVNVANPGNVTVGGDTVLASSYVTGADESRWGPRMQALRAAPLHALPGRVEAESTISPVFTTGAQDVGGGELLGYVPPGGAIFDYPVEIAAAGTYQVSFRVASNYTAMPAPLPDPGFELQLPGTGVLATLDVADTGGWQSWQTVTTGVTLPAGVHRLRLYVPAGHHGFNLNWFDVAPAAGGDPGAGRPGRDIAASRRPVVQPQPVLAQDATVRHDRCVDRLDPSALLDEAAIAAACFGA